MTKFNINNIKNEGKEIRAFIKKTNTVPDMSQYLAVFMWKRTG